MNGLFYKERLIIVMPKKAILYDRRLGGKVREYIGSSIEEDDGYLEHTVVKRSRGIASVYCGLRKIIDLNGCQKDRIG